MSGSVHKNIKCKQLMINLNTRDPFSVLVFICAAAARSLSDMSDKDGAHILSLTRRPCCSLVKTADFCLKMIPPTVLCFYELLAPVQKR